MLQPNFWVCQHAVRQARTARGPRTPMPLLRPVLPACDRSSSRAYDPRESKDAAQRAVPARSNHAWVPDVRSERGLGALSAATRWTGRSPPVSRARGNLCGLIKGRPAQGYPPVSLPPAGFYGEGSALSWPMVSTWFSWHCRCGSARSLSRQEPTSPYVCSPIDYLLLPRRPVSKRPRNPSPLPARSSFSCPGRISSAGPREAAGPEGRLPEAQYLPAASARSPMPPICSVKLPA